MRNCILLYLIVFNYINITSKYKLFYSDLARQSGDVDFPRNLFSYLITSYLCSNYSVSDLSKFLI